MARKKLKEMQMFNATGHGSGRHGGGSRPATATATVWGSSELGQQQLRPGSAAGAADAAAAASGGSSGGGAPVRVLLPASGAAAGGGGGPVELQPHPQVWCHGV